MKKLVLIATLEAVEMVTLYHATYKPLLKSIQKNGLGNTKRKNWEGSESGVVYLASEPEIAESYAEIPETDIPDEWLDEIVILEVRVPKKSLEKDKNVLDGEDTFEYRGIIPWSQIKIWRS